MLGIEPGKAELKAYNSEYREIATNTISNLNEIIGDKVIKIEHVGSTAIIGIKSKPIIDIVIGLKSFNNVMELKQILETNGYLFSKWKLDNSMMAFKVDNGIRRTHNIYLVIYNSQRWKEFVWFRDFLNDNLGIAKQYEQLKLSLSNKYRNDIHKYTAGKVEFISTILNKIERRKTEHRG